MRVSFETIRYTSIFAFHFREYFMIRQIFATITHELDSSIYSSRVRAINFSTINDKWYTKGRSNLLFEFHRSFETLIYHRRNHWMFYDKKVCQTERNREIYVPLTRPLIYFNRSSVYFDTKLSFLVNQLLAMSLHESMKHRHSFYQS